MPEVANQIQEMKETVFNELENIISNQQQLEAIIDRIENQVSEINNRLISVETFTGQFSRGEIKLITHVSNAENSGHSLNNFSHSLSYISNIAAADSSNPDAIALPSDNIDDVQQIPKYEVNNSLETVEKMWKK